MEKKIEDRNDLLLKFFEENKNACVRLHYPHNKGIPCDISFEKLYEIIKLKMEKESDAVHMD